LSILCRLLDKRLKHRRYLGFSGRFQVELIEFSEQIHGGYDTALIA
jgi:hypothetical protein